MKLVRGDDFFRYSDFPWFASDVLVLRPNAVDALAPHLEGVGELLALDVVGDELYALHIFQELDALDVSASTIELGLHGDIMWVDQYVMRPEALHDPFAFELPQLTPSPIFVDEEFVACVERAGLEGLEFPIAWTDDPE